MFTPFLQSTPNQLEGAITKYRIGDIITLPNSGGDTAQVQTVTPGVGTAEATTYKLTESTTGITVTFTSDSSPTAAEVVTGLKAAVQANSILNGLVECSGTTTLILTSRRKGLQAPTLSFSDGGSTPTNVLTVAATTAAADSAIVPYGRGIVSKSANWSAGQLINATLSSTVVLRGFSVFTHGDNTDLPGVADGYRARDAMNVLRQGQFAGLVLTAVTPGSDVWMYFTGANAGRLRASDTGNSDVVQITAGVKFAESVAAGALCKIDVNLPA